MSTDDQTMTVPAAESIQFADTVSKAEQRAMLPLLDLLFVDSDESNDESSVLNIRRFVDGRGLACPMPLLKTKVALRDVAINESLYVVATDPNSQADITAFCRQSQQPDSHIQLVLTVNNRTQPQPAGDLSTKNFDTIYHFIITKTDSN